MSIFQRTFSDAGGRLFGFFRTPAPRSADTAKERLQGLLALERSGYKAAAFGIAMGYLAWCLYTWIAEPLARLWLRIFPAR